jgi:hypothetical protein
LELHDRGTVLGADILWIGIAVDVNSRWTKKNWRLENEQQEKHDVVVDPEWLEYFCFFGEQLLCVDNELESEPQVNRREKVRDDLPVER